MNSNKDDRHAEDMDLASSDSCRDIDSETISLIDESLNCVISIDEVKQMAKKLKNGKASGLDMLSAELLKNANDKFLHIFTKLFNTLLQSGNFPEEWSVGIITVIFKGGDKTDLNNYRGITLFSIFGKFFLGVLLDRLNKAITNFEILEENQVGFRKGYQTSDHIFTLQSIIENAFQTSKGSLYFCFVDYKKAFDSINHKLLLHKLVTYGINGNFLKVISSLYAKVKSCVRGNNGLTEIFPCDKGVRQGCVLSPVLFALYLNDLNSHIKAASQGVVVNDIRIHTLLYADDLVLVAKDQDDLQTQLNTLDSFSKAVKMEVNIDKTKVMVVRKNKQQSRAKNGNKRLWKVGNKDIKECDSYKYLGVTLKSNGSFSEHIDIVKEKAQKAFYSLISKSKEWGGFQPRLFLYLWDHTILPILNYASEVWGVDEWPKLETLHLKACKYALGVRTNTTTDGVYAELGRMSLQCHRHIRILKFYSRLSKLEPERYASQAFLMLVNDADADRSNWISKTRNLRTRYEISSLDNNETTKMKVRNTFASELKNNIHDHIIQDKKLKLYASFKSSFKFESYLDVISNYSTRSILAKLRLSAHNLQIEAGRFGIKKTPRNERFCLYCKKFNDFKVEDETHFITYCPLYNEERKRMLDVIHNKFPSTEQLNGQSLLIWLMSQEEPNIILLLGKFCKISIESRMKFINSRDATTNTQNRTFNLPQT